MYTHFVEIHGEVDADVLAIKIMLFTMSVNVTLQYIPSQKRIANKVTDYRLNFFWTSNFNLLFVVGFWTRSLAVL